MKLYFHPMSGNAQRVTCFLATHQIAFEPQVVALQNGEHKQPEYLALNPMGQVPTLVDGDLVLCESLAILRYVAAEHAPDTLGSTPKERARIDQWSVWGLVHLGASFSALNAAAGLTRMFGGTPDPEIVATRLEEVHRLLGILADKLKDSAFVVGEQPTIADYAIAPMLEATQRFSPELTLDAQPVIAAWMTRITSIPHWPKA